MSTFFSPFFLLPSQHLLTQCLQIETLILPVSRHFIHRPGENCFVLSPSAIFYRRTAAHRRLDTSSSPPTSPSEQLLGALQCESLIRWRILPDLRHLADTDRWPTVILVDYSAHWCVAADSDGIFSVALTDDHPSTKFSLAPTENKKKIYRWYVS